MINALISELSALFIVLERCHAVENFTLNATVSRTALTPPVALLLNSLLAAVQDCHVRIKGIVRQPISLYDDEYTAKSDRQEWSQTSSGPEEYRFEKNAKVDEIENLGFTAGPASPEYLEALNLSVAASPECLEAMNLSVAASPCYQPNDEVHRDTLKTLHDVGTSASFWDLDVGNPVDCFGPEHGATTNLEFDAGSGLGDGYMLDITSQVSVTDAINASIYFGLHRDGHDTTPQKTMPAPAPNFQIPMDLSHPGNLNPDEAVVTEPEKFQCMICGKIVRTKKSLRRHQLAHDEGPLICDHCGKGFHAAWLLRRHVLAHLSGHVCEICGKRCVDKRKLNRHKATHSAGTFACTSCRKCFTRADGLKRHMDIMHHKTKDFSCRLCDRKFSVKCNLKSHLDSVHGQGETVQCDICGKRCKNKDSFRMHLRIHGSPAKTCEICERDFHHYHQYYRHMKNKHGILEK